VVGWVLQERAGEKGGNTVTEPEWLACPYPQEMLRAVGLKVSDRRLRLFAAACCRRSWGQLTDENLRLSIETAELFADGEVGQKRRGSVFAAAQRARVTARTSPPCVGIAASLCSVKNIRLWIGTIWSQSLGGPIQQHASSSAALLRDIVGNPFRPVALDPAWLAFSGGTIPNLARAADEDRLLPSGHLEPNRLAVLADALEEAGCTEASILEHLRGPGPHWRGCFPIDLLLQKG
jgi:hypothetical protein